ncbi:hypothetical protein UFOVP346_63 [uncultured Caudovirales phage]|uniref:Uncharacterized protein n=1 Tax=uncultured Caudovirales phage TaxID=2100421 RepID=A0A6J5LYI8_9CAUD|nr:hypothetical protein UFOVP346_63 [uncultured Caudovirales phage]
MEQTYKTLSELCEAWGDMPDSIRHNMLDCLHARLRDFVYNSYINDMTTYKAGYYNQPYLILERFQPAPAKGNSDLLAIYENRERYDAERRLSGKPGKMLRRMFPFATDSDCESFANWWRDTFRTIDLTVKESKSSEDMARIYQAPFVEGFDMAFGPKTKPLSRSCMRHTPDYFGTPVHPAFAYGTGDFILYWTETADSKVASRVLVSCHKDKLSAGPIYASNVQSFEALAEKLDAIGADREGAWHGARLHKIPRHKYPDDEYVVPYLDCVQTIDHHDESFWVISRHGDIGASSTSGYIRVNEHEYHCDECGDGLNENDIYSGDNGDGCYCESCFNQNFTQWEGETYRNSDCANVYYINIRGSRYTEFRPCYDCEDVVYSEQDGDYWGVDDTTYCESENDYIPNDMIGDGYEVCEESGQLFPDSEMVQINDLWYHKENVPEGYIATENEKGETVYTLADNYQLDDNGKAIRNPELSLVA